MALCTYTGMRIRGVAAAVPKPISSNLTDRKIEEKTRKKLLKTTGVETRRVAPPGMCTSDLAYLASQRLIQELEWKPESVDALILVTQTPDFFLPATSVILQNRLGLSKNCLAFDINLGCSGYVYGLSVVNAFLQNGQLKRALLLSGDVSTISVSERDKSVYPIFGDAATATALEFDQKAKIHYHLQSDGAGYEAIIIKDGVTRNLISESSFEWKTYGEGIERTDRHLALDGIEVLNFALREVKPNVEELLTTAEVGADEIDYYIFHQANFLLNDYVRRKLKIPAEKYPYSLKDFGNTSSASIPLTMVTQLAGQLNRPQKLLLSGFGVGLSWGSAIIDSAGFNCLPIIEV